MRHCTGWMSRRPRAHCTASTWHRHRPTSSFSCRCFTLKIGFPGASLVEEPRSCRFRFDRFAALYSRGAYSRKMPQPAALLCVPRLGNHNFAKASTRGYLALRVCAIIEDGEGHIWKELLGESHAAQDDLAVFEKLACARLGPPHRRRHRRASSLYLCRKTRRTSHARPRCGKCGRRARPRIPSSRPTRGRHWSGRAWTFEFGRSHRPEQRLVLRRGGGVSRSRAGTDWSGARLRFSET